jgi:acetyl-CoA carboxylase biotin carboxyl carrier protein
MATAKKKGVAGEFVYGTTSLDVEALRQVVEILEASEVSSLVWKNGDEKLVIRRGPPGTQVVQHMSPMPMSTPGVHLTHAAPVSQAAAPTPANDMKPRPTAPPKAAAPGGDKKGHVVTSPFVGTFYRTPAPDQPPYAEVGTMVKKGQVLCIVEAMKLMNEIESEVSGKVAEVLVQNATPVEFGQPLFRIEPA